MCFCMCSVEDWASLLSFAGFFFFWVQEIAVGLLICIVGLTCTLRTFAVLLYFESDFVVFYLGIFFYSCTLRE